MKYKTIVLKYILACLLFFNGFIYANAQQASEPAKYNKDEPSNATRGFTLHLGSSVNYYQGESSRNLDTFESDRIGWQINGMLGYGINKNNYNHSNILGVFGTGGYTSESVLNLMLTDQSIIVDDLKPSKYYNFYKAEAGMLIAEMLRLSTGVGFQQYATESTGNERLFYTTSTAGFTLSFGASVYWVFNVNFISGRDFNNTVIRVGTGLNIAL